MEKNLADGMHQRTIDTQAAIIKSLTARLATIATMAENGEHGIAQLARDAAGVAAPAKPQTGEATFKNFHRSLCARFGYTHDEQFWWRDLVSLEEAIARKVQSASAPSGAVPDEMGDTWHSLTCDGTCSPPCKDAPKQKCGACCGSGWVPRDPYIGTEQECFCCGGSGVSEDAAAQPLAPIGVVRAYSEGLEDGERKGRAAGAPAETAKPCAFCGKKKDGTHDKDFPHPRLAMPSSLAAQIASARAVVATLPPEILASVQLEGFDRFPATAPDVAKDAARLENMPNLIADFIEDNWKMKKYSLEEIGIGVRGLDLAAMGALPPTDSPTTTKAENDNS